MLALPKFFISDDLKSHRSSMDYQTICPGWGEPGLFFGEKPHIKAKTRKQHHLYPGPAYEGLHCKHPRPFEPQLGC